MGLYDLARLDNSVSVSGETDDEMEGDGDEWGSIEEKMGALAAPPSRVGRPRQPAGAPTTRKHKRDRWREQPLPLTAAAATAAGASGSVTNSPQEMFRAKRLIVASSIASFFTIQDLKIGKNSQFIASGSLPAEGFSQLGVAVSLRGDTARIGITIVISFTNIDAAAHTFSSMIIGDSLQ